MERMGQLSLFASSGKVVSLNPHSLFEDALRLDDEGHPDARAAYERAIAAGDQLADAWCNLGILESREGNGSRAVDCFTQCLAREPRHFEAHYNLANLYAEQGNFLLAKMHYQFAIDIAPDFSNSYFNLALTQAMLRQVEDAIITLNRYRKMVVGREREQADQLISSLLNARV